MSPNDNVKVLGMPVSTPNASSRPSSKKKIASLQQPRQQLRELRNTQRHQLDPRQRCQLLKGDPLDLLEMAMCLVSVVWCCRWLIASLEKICPLPCESPKQAKAQSLTTIIATAFRGGLLEYVSSTILMPTPRHRHGPAAQGLHLVDSCSVALIPGLAGFHKLGQSCVQVRTRERIS